MLKNIELTNFKRHEFLRVDFTAGLNVIKGANEKGKSSLFQAVAYAYYGTKALEMSLDETVTWGKPTASLKVVHEFSHAGIDYKITRGKSGAELTSTGLIVSGQTEVTAYVERLFKVNAGVASAIMLANQGQIRGTLEGGAVPLIEKLSDLALIDNLITKVQDKLPCGNSKQLELKVVELSRDLQEPTLNSVDAVMVLAEATAKLKIDESILAAMEFATLGEAAKEAQVRLQRSAAQKAQYQSLVTQKSTLETKLAGSALLPVVDLTDLEAEAVEQAQYKEKHAAYLSWQAVSATINGYRDRLENSEQIANCQATLKTAEKTKAAKLTEFAVVKASGIYDESCALCGKLLQDVPEVVAVNAATAAKLEQIQLDITAVTETITAAKEKIAELQALDTLDSNLQKLVDKNSKYLQIDTSFVPYLVTWKSETSLPTEEVSTKDYKSLLLQARQANATAISNNAVYTASLQSLEKLKCEVEQFEAFPYDEKGDREIIAEAEAEIRHTKMAADTAAASRIRVADAAFALKSLENAYLASVSAYQLRVATLAEVQTMLEAYNTHNAIIKKLRDARPIVAKRLWNLVLSSVSQHFSTIRGVPSVVTRIDNGFMIDSKPVAAYSGSTKDSLGLAIRIALQKTFLGNVGFLLVDEPASGCDADRETDMLGVLVGAGYDQVLLVTHSSLADVFAANLIEI